MLVAWLQVAALVAQAAYFEAGAVAGSKGMSSEEVVALQGVWAWVRAGAWKVVAWEQGVAAWRPELWAPAAAAYGVPLLRVGRGVAVGAGLSTAHYSLPPGQGAVVVEPAATAVS